MLLVSVQGHKLVDNLGLEYDLVWGVGLLVKNQIQIEFDKKLFSKLLHALLLDSFVHGYKVHLYCILQ